MSFWTSVKKILRNILPVSRTYLDNKLSKTSRQETLLRDLQKKSDAQAKAIDDLKKYVEQELRRRDDWGKRAAENRRNAQGKPIWVIKCPAPEAPRKVAWGDYSYAVTLKRYLDRMGVYTIIDTREDWDCEEGAEVVLVLRGLHFYRPDRRNENCLYIMWNISHPDMVTPEEYELYDVVCIGSGIYAERLKEKVKVPVLPLRQCTDTELFYPAQEPQEQKEYDYIFIGNTRGVARNCVIWAAQEKLPLKIWGGGWGRILTDHKDMVQATSIENSQIPDLYRSAKATLNDHWKDMLDCQFVNNRIFDALACGLPVISDYCQELKEIFPDAVLYYDTKEEFDACIRTLETDYDSVKKRVDAQWELIKEEYSFEKRAKELIEIAGKYKRV